MTLTPSIARLVTAMSLVCFVAPVRAATQAVPVSVTAPADQALETGSPLKVQATLSNTTDNPVSAEIEFLVQRDPSMYSVPAPDPRYGPNIALTATSWAEGRGEQVVERNEVWGMTNGKQTSINALTDGFFWTEFGTVFDSKSKWTETFGYIDLGKSSRVVHISADMRRQPDKTGRIDFSMSLDGKDYRPIEGLQNLDFTQFGRREVDVPKPFEARFIRMRLHQNGQAVPFFRYPANVQVYGGIDENTWAFPKTGPEVMKGNVSRDVPAGNTVTVELGDGRSLEPGSYLVAIRTKATGTTQLDYSRLYVMSPATESKGDGRFGINVSDSSHAPILKREGNAWARFELQWPLVSPEAGQYRFNAPIAPGNTTYDGMIHAYRATGMSVLPTLFLTPSYLVPKDPKAPAGLNPPTDPSKFGEFVFQTVARYGNQKHESSELLTEDRVSGLGQIDAVQLWDEPNNQNTRKSNWKGSIEDYYTMFRIGAEAAKKADPSVRVLNGAWSHAEIPLVQSMSSIRYPDGKTPLDFTDVLSFNYFSFRVVPERATVYDISHHHEYLPYDRTVETDFSELVAWRDRNKSTMPIWVTAAGHDAMDVDERLQAAWMVRGAISVLAAGVDKVIVHQDRGNSAFQDGATGILRDDRTLKPAWFTYATLIQQFNDVSSRGMKLVTGDDNVRAYLWKRNGKPFITAWAINGAAKLPIHLGKCTVIDAFGGRQSVEVDQALSVSEFPSYVADFEDPAVITTIDQLATQIAATERARLERQSNLRAYLFKFGKNERQATMVVGKLRTFMPVVAADVYDDAKGFGFVDSKGLSDSSLPYYQNPLTDTGVKSPAKTRFMFKAEAGDYDLQMCVRAPDREVKFTGLASGELTLKGSFSNIISRAVVKVGEQPITLETPTGAELVWMSLVQKDEATAAK